MVHIYLQKFLLIGMSAVKIPVYLYNSRQKGDLPPDSDLVTSKVFLIPFKALLSVLAHALARG